MNPGTRAVILMFWKRRAGTGREDKKRKAKGK